MSCVTVLHIENQYGKRQTNDSLGGWLCHRHPSVFAACAVIAASTIASILVDFQDCHNSSHKQKERRLEKTCPAYAFQITWIDTPRAQRHSLPGPSPSDATAATASLHDVNMGHLSGSRHKPRVNRLVFADWQKRFFSVKLLSHLMQVLVWYCWIADAITLLS